MIVQLEAIQEYDPPYLVSVHIGGIEIAALKPVTKSEATKGDDLAYWESENKRVVDETVAEWLRSKLA